MVLESFAQEEYVSKDSVSTTCAEIRQSWCDVELGESADDYKSILQHITPKDANFIHNFIHLYLGTGVCAQQVIKSSFSHS